MKKYLNIDKEIDSEIKLFLDSKIKSSPNKFSKDLLLAAKELFLRGGKRSRPRLFFLTLEAYGLDNPVRYIKLALALEFYHQFLLIHDDIIDKDYIRYNGPNIAGHYIQDYQNKDKTIPDSMALLAGDIVYSYVYEIISSDTNLTSNQKIDITKLFSYINESVIFGQQMDTLNVDSLNSQVNVEQLIEIHRLKTASYSIMLPMRLAGIILNLEAKEIEAINKFSQSFGIYYQLADDYSDYFENKSAFNNREKYRDYKEGRRTCPIIFGLESAQGGDFNIIKKNFGNKKSTANDISSTIKILKKYEANKKSKELADFYYNESLNSLNALSIESINRNKYISLMSNFGL